jgi:hypothetical protein
MAYVALRQGCAHFACLGLALVALVVVPAGAAPPVVIGSPVLLDRIGSSAHVQVAGNGRGLVAMAWAASPTLLQARVYDASGPALTPVFEVSRDAVPLAALYVAADSSGGILLGWARGDQGGPLLARRYGWDGSPATPESVVGTLAAGILPQAIYRSFAFHLAGDGSFLVAYQKAGSPGPEATLVVRAFDAGGQPRGAENLVSAAPEPSFARVALAQRGQDGVVVYAKLGDAGRTTEVWARRIDDLGVPRSAEIAAVPLAPGFGHLPSGVALYPGGRLAVGYQVCDPLVMDFECAAAGMQWIGPDDTVLPDTDGADLIFHGSAESWLVPDALGNPFAFTAGDGAGSLRAANPLGVAVSRTSVSSGLPTPLFPGIRRSAGLVPLGPAAFGLIWYTGDWSYLQTVSVGAEGTPASFLHTLEPCRLVDTRLGATPLGAGVDNKVLAVGRCSVPVGARVLAANVVSVESNAPGDLRFYRADRLVPEASVLNYGAGQVRASQTLIPLSDDGALGVRATQPAGTTHLIIDVAGYFQ